MQVFVNLLSKLDFNLLNLWQRKFCDFNFHTSKLSVLPSNICEPADSKPCDDNQQASHFPENNIQTCEQCWDVSKKNKVKIKQVDSKSSMFSFKHDF